MMVTIRVTVRVSWINESYIANCYNQSVQSNRRKRKKTLALCTKKLTHKAKNLCYSLSKWVIFRSVLLIVKMFNFLNTVLILSNCFRL